MLHYLFSEVITAKTGAGRNLARWRLKSPNPPRRWRRMFGVATAHHGRCLLAQMIVRMQYRSPESALLLDFWGQRNGQCRRRTSSGYTRFLGLQSRMCATAKARQARSQQRHLGRFGVWEVRTSPQNAYVFRNASDPVMGACRSQQLQSCRQLDRE